MPEIREQVKCGSLKIPGVSYGLRKDETDHCFPTDASHHYVCCTQIKDPENELNTVSENGRNYTYRNPLAGPIKRNSDPNNYSWCTCTEHICENQLKGKVEWVATPAKGQGNIRTDI